MYVLCMLDLVLKGFEYYNYIMVSNELASRNGSFRPLYHHTTLIIKHIT